MPASILNPTMTDICGIYRHFRGKDYAVIGRATTQSTGERLVLYRQLYAPFGLWLRPEVMFFETTVQDGAVLPRFCKIAPLCPDPLNGLNPCQLVATHSETEGCYQVIGQASGIYLAHPI